MSRYPTDKNHLVLGWLGLLLYFMQRCYESPLDRVYTMSIKFVYVLYTTGVLLLFLPYPGSYG